jgi:hypothetical protein
MPPKRNASIAFLAACAISGALLDFAFNGVFKIVWFVVYGPAYCAAAKVLDTQLSRLRPSWPVRPAVVALLGGALIGHLVSVGRTRRIEYSLKLVSDSPITLRSGDWPQILVVSSEKLGQRLATLADKSAVPIVLDAVTDYGCYRSVKIATVAGVDVQTDPNASWTWRMENRQPVPVDVGPGSEDRVLPWCLIKFYRGT